MADYCYIRDIKDEALATVLVAKLDPSQALFACICEDKKTSETAIAKLAQFIKNSGHRRIVYRSDQEPSIRFAFEEAFKASCREGSLYNERLAQMVPEISSVGESQSNGRAERSVQQLQDLVRTYKSALESRLNWRVPTSHPIIHWMVEHAASVFNRYVTNSDGVTPYQLMHGQRFKGSWQNSKNKYSTMYLSYSEPN